LRSRGRFYYTFTFFSWKTAAESGDASQRFFGKISVVFPSRFAANLNPIFPVLPIYFILRFYTPSAFSLREKKPSFRRAPLFKINNLGKIYKKNKNRSNWAQILPIHKD
jgi:hypothetical protein